MHAYVSSYMHKAQYVVNNWKKRSFAPDEDLRGQNVVLLQSIVLREVLDFTTDSNYLVHKVRISCVNSRLRSPQSTNSSIYWQQFEDELGNSQTFNKDWRPQRSDSTHRRLVCVVPFRSKCT